MKRIKEIILSALGILVLIVAIIAVIPNRISSPSSQGSGGYPGVSAIETAYPIFVQQIDTTVVEQPNSTPIIPTPIPIMAGAFQAEETTKLTIDVTLNVEQIFDDYDVHGDYLIAKVRLVNGDFALVELNLNDGSTRLLVDLPQGLTDLHVADNYIIWLTSVQETGEYERLLHVFDRANNTVATLHSGKIEQLDIRDTFVIWVDSTNKNIVMYDLATQQTETITSSSGAARFPRVCSGEWLAFLHNFTNQETFVSTTSASISLYNLSSGQEVLVGNVSGIPNIPGVRNTSFDCDEQRLVWVSTDDETNLHMYDFASASETVIEELTGDFAPYDGFVLLDGDIIISQVGYDLAQNVPFTPILDRSKIFGPLYLSNNRLVWVENHQNQAGEIYLVSFFRGGQ